MLQDRIVQDPAKLPSRPGQPFRWSPELLPGLIHTIELVMITLVGGALCIGPSLETPEYLAQHVFCVVFLVVCFMYMAQWGRLTGLNALMRPIGQADNIIVAVTTAFLFLLSVLYGLDVAYRFNMSWLLTLGGATMATVLAVRLAAFAVLRHLSQRQAIGRHLAVLGTGPQSARVLRQIARDPPYFTALHGVFRPEGAPDHGSHWQGHAVLGGLEELLRDVREGLVDDIIVAMPWQDDRGMVETIERLKELPVNVYIASDLAGFDLAFRPVLGTVSQIPAFEVVQRPISGWSSAAKKLLDYTVALTALALLSPLLLLVAVAIKLDSPGPVFFMQQRLGFNNKPFAIYKFRSMYHREIPEERVRQATKDDPRVTRVGRIIRATSIDELPQLLNVLDGTMSIVGPRPHALSHNQEYGAQIRGYFARHKVKPGITGWAQVKGLRGETPDLEKMRQRVEHDVFYTENWSIFFDIKIIVMTALVVLTQKTAY